MAEKVEKKETSKKVDVNKWIAKRLVAVNQMKDKAKAKAAAARLMMNKRGK